MRLRRQLSFTGVQLDRKLELLIPHVFLGFSLAFYLVYGTKESVAGLAIAALFWLSALLVPRLVPIEKPTKLQAEIKKLDAIVVELNRTVNANAEYSAKEFGTLKNVLQIKQMGLR